LREFRRKLSRIDPGLSKTTLAAMADLYLNTIEHRSHSTKKARRGIVKRLKELSTARTQRHWAISNLRRLNHGWRNKRPGWAPLMAWLERRVELLVEKQWPRIHKLAFALLERERLSGAEIDKILIGNT
jgi:hypothetical protein